VSDVPATRSETSQRPSALWAGPLASDALVDRTLIFMHVPKTGGTSLRAALLEAYRPDESALVYEGSGLRGAMSEARFAELPEEVRGHVRLIIGHFGYGIHEHVPGESRYVTVVRDPVERVVSLYYHYRNLPGIRLGGREHRQRWGIRWRRASLEDWVFGERRRSVDNAIVRRIAGRRDVPFGGCSDEMFDEAMEHIDRHFTALLVMEQMDQSALLLERLIGRALTAVVKQNANPRRPALDSIDPSLRARIRELNRLDGRLHQVACARLGEAMVRGFP
jgi:hypothetical protein